MSKEQLATSRWDWSELSFGLLGMVEHGRERLHKVRSNLEGRRVVESAHKNWDNTNYCRSLSQDAPHQYTYQQLLDVFPANFRAFTDEYCLGTLVQEYPLVVDKRGMLGLDDTYKEPLTDQAPRFQEKLSRTGKRQQRGTIETFNSQRLDTWLSTVCHNEQYPFGTKLVWCSPPGFKVEGYHGTSSKHHSFIWVYEKELGPEGQPRMSMTQFRCWPNLSQMERVQHTLRLKAQPTDVLEDAAVPTNKLSRRNSVIAEFIELPAAISMDEIEDTIYETEDSWQVQREDMPQLSEERLHAFAQYRDDVLHQFLIPTYQALLAPMSQLLEPYSSPFWRSPEYIQLIQQMDLAFAIAWQHLMKYVEAVDQRPTAQALPALPLAELQRVAHLREIFALKVKSDKGDATKEDRKRFNDLAPQLLSVGSTALSVGQCGIGTLIPVQLFKGLEGFESLQGFSSLSKLSKFDIAKLSAAEQLAFKSQVLRQYKPLTLIGKFGQKETFWVQNEYYQQYLQGSRVTSSGEFIGPCDIPLTTGADNLVLTNAKYQELFQAATQPALPDLAQLDLDEKDSLSQARTEDERAQIRQAFSSKRSQLKHRVSVTQLINNDLFRPTFARV